MSISTADPTIAIQRVISQIGGQVQVGSTSSTSNTQDTANVSAAVVAGIRDAALNNPRLTQNAQKAANIVRVADPTEINSKDFWDDMFRTVNQYLPVIVQAVSKDYTPPRSVNDIRIPANRQNDKGWFDFVAQALTTIVPQAVSMLQGKDYNPSTLRQPTAPANADKDWFSDALGIATQVLPFVLAAI